MKRTLTWLGLAAGFVTLPALAVAQKGQQFDFLFQSTQKSQQSKSAQRQHSQEFADKKKACLDGTLTACEEALAHPSIRSRDRKLLEARRVELVAEQDAAERRRVEAELVEQARQQADRLAALKAARELEERNSWRYRLTALYAAWQPPVAVLAGAATALGLVVLYIVARLFGLRPMRLLSRLKLPRFKLPRPSLVPLRARFARRERKPAQAAQPAPAKPVPAQSAPARPVAPEPQPQQVAAKALPAAPREPLPATRPRETAAALAALELAYAYVEEVREAEVPAAEDAVMRKLHLNTLELASKQLDIAHKMDPDAILDARDQHGNQRRFSINQLRAEGLLLEGLIHQVRDIRRAVQALTAATQADPGNPHAFFALGLSQAAAKNKKAAIAALQRAVALNPKSVTYRKELNRVENLTSAEVAGYKATRPGERIVDASIAGRGITAMAWSIARLPQRAFVGTLRLVRPSSLS